MLKEQKIICGKMVQNSLGPPNKTAKNPDPNAEDVHMAVEEVPG
jgi:hypothetical protein